MRCPVCDSPLVRQSDWLRGCDSCGFLGSELKPGSGLGPRGLELLRRRNFRRLCDRLAALKSLEGCSCLEVGCAEGWFLEEARARGMRVRAVEPSSTHADIARGKGFNVTTDFFPDAPKGDETFDLIVFNDVFEHLPSPEIAITACERLLRPGGLVAINLPSSTGTLYAIARALKALGRPAIFVRMWQKDFSSPHISYFNPRTLRMLVERHTQRRQVDLFRLDTLAMEGLLARVRSSHSGITAWLLCLGLLPLVPLLRVLPPDIIVGVYRRTQRVPFTP